MGTKLNLSVVMSIIDKAKKPLDGMASSSDYYARKIDKIQKKQKDDTAALSMLSSYQSLRKAIKDNALSLDVEQEKLQKLQEKLRTMKEPSAALTQQIVKQKEKLDSLSVGNDAYVKKLKSLGKELNRSGVNLTRVDDEVKRLTKSQKAHQKDIDKTSVKYQRLRKVLTPFTKMNQAIKLPTLESAKGMAMGSAGAFGALAGFGLIVTDTAEEVRRLAQASEDTKMPVDALQALRQQAMDAGAEAEDMDAALREMNLRWGEMKSMGSGAMNDYFKDTGNRQAYEDLKNAKNAQDAYLVLVREISAETDDAKRSFMMDEFFGGDSEKMMKVLGGGLNGYQQAMQKLQDTGGPVTQESIDSAQEFSLSFKTIKAILNSLKISALTPIMKELASSMGHFAEEMKNLESRNKLLDQLKNGVTSVFTGIKALGSGLMFLGENFKEVLAVIALVKIGFIALNAVVMANPFGLMVAGIAAVAVGVTYLLDKFGVFSFIIDGAKAAFLSFVDMIPESLIPDSWNESFKKMRAEMKATKEEFNGIQDKNTHVSVTSKMNASSTPGATNSPVSATPAPISATPMNYAPLGSQTVKSQSEVSLMIKSDKPVRVESMNSDKATDVSVNLGNMAMSF
ncbi:hypothetical protein [Vibrio scophthalmi]|uniref:Phage tail tape measure protein domain-containing protein n=1 Tax=Vibrio scophthalmi TaxID=45658 RepID=A0A1E3WJQ5_9VIBR|nr:hypothetical protein [Vibrio scophthalmi]ODS09737.1 hypothetical protein VSF3289_03199 [Vibrio scophthalmi]